MNVDWIQHKIIILLSKGDSLSIRLFPILQKELFTGIYKPLFKRLESYYVKKGRFLKYSELIEDLSIEDRIRSSFHSREIRRKKLVKVDKSLKLPLSIEEASTSVKSLITNTQFLGLIKLQNDLSEDLKKYDAKKTDASIKVYLESLQKLESLKSSFGTVLSVSKLNDKELFSFLVTKNKNFYMPTGFSDFDKINIGIPKDSSFLITANTGGGKSTFSLQLCINAFKRNYRVCLVPLEMSHEQNMLRLISNVTNIDKDKIRDFPKKYKKKILRTLKTFFKQDNYATFDFYIPEEPSTVIEILSRLHPQKYDLIIIDSITLTEPLHQDQARSLDMAGRFCKNYATRNNTAIGLTAQWDVDSQRIRYSRALMEHASNAFKWVATEEEIKETNSIEVHQPKARNQKPFPFRLFINPATSAIGDFNEMGVVGINNLSSDLNSDV